MYNGVEANWLPYSLWDLTAANADGAADAGELQDDRRRRRPADARATPASATTCCRSASTRKFQILPGVEHLGGQYLNEGSGLRFLDDHFATVPEPAGVAVLQLAALAALARRRCWNRRACPLQCV